MHQMSGDPGQRMAEEDLAKSVNSCFYCQGCCLVLAIIGAISGLVHFS